MRDCIMYSFSNDSQGSKLVADALGIKRMRHEGSNWTPSHKKVVVNWGAGDPPDVIYRAGRIINHPDAVMGVIDKGRFFHQLNGEDIPDAPHVPSWTISAPIAKQWLQQGHIVIARQDLQGARGRGIVVMKKPLDFVPAPLYTKYIHHEGEYRIHVVNGKCVFRQQKIWDEETPRTEENRYVRNRENGYILVTKVRPIPQDVIDQSIKAVRFFGLDFGAVDIVCKDGLGYVLEINSAPWMDEDSAEAYAEELREMIG